MYTVVVYDVAKERVGKVCQFLRRFLNWIQNSAFEGETTPAKLAEIKAGLSDIMDKGEDSVIFFVVSDQKWLRKETLGVEKSPVTTLI